MDSKPILPTYKFAMTVLALVLFVCGVPAIILPFVYPTMNTQQVETLAWLRETAKLVLAVFLGAAGGKVVL